MKKVKKFKDVKQEWEDIVTYTIVSKLGKITLHGSKEKKIYNHIRLELTKPVKTFKEADKILDEALNLFN